MYMYVGLFRAEMHLNGDATAKSNVTVHLFDLGMHLLQVHGEDLVMDGL